MAIESTQLSEYLGTVALAVGGLGAASYGVVDGLKLFPWVDLAGFERLFGSRGTEGSRSWPILQRAGLDPLPRSSRRNTAVGDQRATCRRQLEFQFQSNTRRSCPVLSVISLALQLVQHEMAAFPPREFREALDRLRHDHPALQL